MSKSTPPREQNFRTVLEDIARKKGSLVSVFSDFACVAACAYAMQTREEEYLETAGRYNRDELDEFAKAMGMMVMEMERKPFTDILGIYYCEIQSKSTRDARGEFYTPQPVSKMMARMMVPIEEAIKAGKPITICDPAAGSGGMILSLAEEFAQAKAVDLIRATCMDINKTACDMAYINMTLWGVPARITWGNSLANSIDMQWENIHWHRVGEPQREMANAILDLIRKESEPKKEMKQAERNTKRDVQFSENAAGQQEWVFS